MKRLTRTLCTRMEGEEVCILGLHPHYRTNLLWGEIYRTSTGYYVKEARILPTHGGWKDWLLTEDETRLTDLLQTR